MDDLAKLSAMATPGVWEAFKSYANTGASITEVANQSADTVIGEYGIEADDAAFIVRVVNAYRSGELIPTSELAELRAENARLREENARLIQPTWFYAEGWEEYCFLSPNEVVDHVDPTADCVIEIATARPLPSIWAAIRCAIGDDADEPWTFTEHATEGEARAALGEQR